MGFNLLSNHSKNVLIQTVLFVVLIQITFQSILLLKQVQPHSAQVTAIQFTGDLKKVITASTDGTFIVWNALTLSQIATKNIGIPINGLGINPVTNDIIVLLNNGTVQIYDMNTLTKTNNYIYPNSGKGRCIQFFNRGASYALGGLDTGQIPQIHFFDSVTHVLLGSVTTSYGVGISITKMLNQMDRLILIASDQTNAPIAIQMYSQVGGNYVLAKKFIQSNGKVIDFSMNMKGQSFYSIAEDLTFRTYSPSSFDQIFEISSVQYFDSNPVAIDATISEFTYIAFSNQINQYFKTGQVSIQTVTPTSSQVNKMVNDYPLLFCSTIDGKLIIYQIQTVSLEDKDTTKWIILASVMGGLIFILLVALVIEIIVSRRKQQFQEEQQEKLSQISSKYNKNQIA